MMPWQRGPERAPGDLYLDPTLPDGERVAVSCGPWTAEATHVWTGGGWARLLTVPVQLVPGASPAASALGGAGEQSPLLAS